MVYVLGWMAVVALLALWSLFAYGLNAVSVWATSNAANFESAVPNAERLVPAWLAPWMPAEFAEGFMALKASLMAIIESLQGLVPALGDGLTVAIWIVWGIGTALVVALGAVVHVLVAKWHQRFSGAKPRAA